jgi:hypothetical protein
VGVPEHGNSRIQTARRDSVARPPDLKASPRRLRRSRPLRSRWFSAIFSQTESMPRGMPRASVPGMPARNVSCRQSEGLAPFLRTCSPNQKATPFGVAFFFQD